MAYSLRKKLNILNKILKNYKKHLMKCSKMYAMIEYDNIIIVRINGTLNKVKIKIPVSDIDLTIIRYRALVHQKNRKIKGLYEAIQESDIMNLRETLKQITNESN